MKESSQALIKIAVVGPESTGKSTMAKYLAEKLHTLYVPEYARYYCQYLNKNYTLEDEVNMFYGQMALEDTIVQNIKSPVLICDTTILTIKIWCDRLFGFTPDFVREEIKKRKYDLYLLMDIDLPWEDDPLRDFPHEREYFLKVWKQEIHNLNGNYILISGQGEERLKAGLEACKKIIAPTSGNIY